MIGRVATQLAGAAMKIAVVILAAMTTGVVYEVAMRNLFNSPTVWSVEYASYAMAWLGLLGAAETLRRNDHVGIRVLTDRLPGRARWLVLLFGNLMVGIVACWLTYASGLWTASAFRLNEVSDTVLQTPQGFIRLAFPIGMFLVVLIALARVIEGFSNRARSTR
jgi:TRAP-type C4-dicarboxylate transport system permease small subunit